MTMSLPHDEAWQNHAVSDTAPTVSLRPVWIATGVLALGDLLLGLWLGFSLSWPMLALPGGATLLACGLRVVYTTRRPDPRIAEMAGAAAFLIVFTLALAIASYLLEALALPIQDDIFQRIDAAIGFDFLAHLAWLRQHPTFSLILSIAYLTSIGQVILLAFTLPLLGHFDRLRRFLILFAGTATTVIVLAALMPTLGTCGIYDLPDAVLPAFVDPQICFQHLDHLKGLRDGSLRHLPLDDIRGLVAFPSFHTALALVTLWAARPLRWIFPPLVVVNALLIFATPSNGSHYAADVLGGALIALAWIAIIRRPTTRGQSSNAPVTASE